MMIGRGRALHRADLGNGDCVVAEELEQERLELVVGAVDLVDEQDGAVRRCAGR